jgi:hypothetical protein
MQPPLKTANSYNMVEDFKEEWRTFTTREVLDYVKK